jgi:uncharacterized protein YjgD (DUF1641 family)
MEKKQIEQQLLQIHEKLNAISGQLELQQRRQREWEELKQDLSLVGKDVFQTVVSELDEVAYHFDMSDIAYLLKKLLRNTRNLTKLVDQIESTADFARDAAPLSKQIFHQLMQTLDELEKKGYFEFAGEFFKIFDTVITSFTVEDVKLLRENITSILLTFKNLTQPEMLSSVNNALNFFRKMDVVVKKDLTYWDLIKAMRDPEMKRGIAFVIEFMKSMAYKNGQDLNVTQININQK